VTRLNGRKGVDKLGEYRNAVYTPPYQKLTLNEVTFETRLERHRVEVDDFDEFRKFRAGRLADAVAAQRAAVQLRPRDKELAEQLAAFEKAARDKGVKAS
jgi:hypothetical protein